MSYISNDKRTLYKTLLLIIVISTILSIGMRLYSIKLINDKYKAGMIYDANVKQAKYYSVENGYVYRFAEATFFNTTCFLTISTEEDSKLYINEAGQVYSKDMQIILYVWPTKNKYGLLFFADNDKEKINFQVYIDKNMKCISEDEEYREYMNEMIIKYKPEIENLLREANEKWNLN